MRDLPIVPEAEPELDKIIECARYYADSKTKSQKEIALRMHVNASKISRWLEKAEKHNILQTIVRVPRLSDDEERLGKKLQGSCVRRVVVVPPGPGNNLENLGDAGAAAFLDALFIVDRSNKSLKEPIRIVFACGKTVLKVIEYIVKRVEEYCLDERQTFLHRVWELYPSTLYGDFQLRAPYPQLAVNFMTIQFELSIPKHHVEIRAFTPQLPPKFYRLSAEEQKNQMQIDYEIDKFFAELRKKADIFVIGAGTADNPEYNHIRENIGLRVRPEFSAGEVLYIPLNEGGHQDEQFASKIVGITVEDLRSVVTNKRRHVILVAGGESKRRAIQPIIRNPCYSTLITDTTIAEEALKGYVAEESSN